MENDYHASQGRIKRLEVENFKSYKGHQLIGPFKPFTAVIGPNGSGKSNLMDAISFVLGVKTAQLRGSLKELLYSDGGATGQPRRGYVKLVYGLEVGHALVRVRLQADQARTMVVPMRAQEWNDDTRTLAERELTFSRVITPTSSDPEASFKSEYRVDDRTVTWEAYSSKLATLGILVKVRNFLVFQVSVRGPRGPSVSISAWGSSLYRIARCVLWCWCSMPPMGRAV